jgi:hypothetical protein
MEMKRFLAATALLAFATAPSWGAIIPSLVAVTGTGPYTFFYELDQAAGTKLDTTENEEQTVVIYDFAGWTGIAGSGSTSGNFVITSVMTGPFGPALSDPNAAYSTFPTPPDLNDDPLLPNLVFTYNGPMQNSPTGIDNFDQIFADSIFPNVTRDLFRGQGTKVVPPPDPSNENNTAAGTIGSVGVPSPEPDVIIPEPGTYALLGSGLLGIAFFRRKRS